MMIKDIKNHANLKSTEKFMYVLQPVPSIFIMDFYYVFFQHFLF